MIKIAPTIVIVIAALAVAGCGSSSDSGGGAYGSGGEATGSRRDAGSEGSSAPTGIVSVANVAGVGSVLVDSKGHTLYFFEKDENSKSACYEACAAVWPPLSTGGAPKATGGAQPSKLGTTKRSDGTTQVTYAGWPLYTYAPDTRPGQAKGNDIDSFGAEWYALTPSGEKPED